MKYVEASKLPFETPFFKNQKTYLCKICQNNLTTNKDGICNICKKMLYIMK